MAEGRRQDDERPRAFAMRQGTREVDRFFDENLKQIALDSSAVVRQAARELERDIQRQIRRNFNNPSLAFRRGVKFYEFERAAYVGLSPILSVHAEPTILEGNPNLWILLPEGEKLGFKRVGAGFNWDFLKRRHGSKLSFVPVEDGHVLLYKTTNGAVPIYKIQEQVETEQRIDFYDRAEKIGEKYGAEYSRKGSR